MKLFTFCKCPGCGRRYIRWRKTYKPFCDQLCMKVHERRWYHAEDTNRAQEIARMERSAEYRRRITEAETAGKQVEADSVVREFLDLLNKTEPV